MGRVDALIEEWKRNLIDLTRRNRLLFFTPTRTSSLRVDEPPPHEVFRRLVIEEQPWRFLVPSDDEAEGFESQTPAAVQSLFELPSAQGPPNLERITRKANELLCHVRDARALRAALRNLHRRSRTDFEERGVRILHVSFGILEWQDSREAGPSRSPLVLVPALMSRESVNDPFELAMAEEEIVLNPALEVKLGNDFRIDLPPLPDDWDQASLEGYLGEVQTRVSSHGWAVRPECWIGLFSFHKLVIYQDLNGHAHLIREHLIPQALAQDINAAQVSSGDPPDPSGLDRNLHPKDSYLVMDTDSSQLACIEAAKAGLNLVIQGPPGTGKSQTIANLIAESIAVGRRVLFVSEKMAALEVVYKRLRQAMLDHYCLELHSHKANKREVVRELYESYSKSLRPSSVMTDAELTRLASRREHLNRYVYNLHLIREPLGQSAYAVLGQLAALDEVEFVPAGRLQIENLAPLDLDAAVQLAMRLARVWRVVREGDSFPWRGCSVASYGVETRTTFQALLRTCEEALSELAVESQRLADTMALDPPYCLADAEWLLQTARILKEGPGVEAGWLLAPELESFSSEAQRYGELARQRQSIAETLSQSYSEAFFRLPASVKEELGEALDSVSALLGRDPYREPLVASLGKTIIRWLHNLSARLDDWDRDASVASRILGLPTPDHIDALWRLIRIADLCTRDDRPDQRWFDPVLLDHLNEAIPDLALDYANRAIARARVLQDYEEGFLTLDLVHLLEAVTTNYASPMKWLKPGFHRLRRQVRRYRRDCRNSPTLWKDLRAALDVVQLEAKISDDSPRVEQLLGAWYRGYDTNFERITVALDVAKELLVLTGGEPPKELIAQACLGSYPSLELQQAAGRLRSGLETFERETDSVDRLLPDQIPSTGLPFRQSRRDDLRAWTKSLLSALTAAVDRYGSVQASFRTESGILPSRIIADLTSLAALRELDGQIAREADHLKQKFGTRYQGIETDWDAMLSAIRWTRKLRDCFPDRPIPSRLIEVAQMGSAEAPDLGALQDRVEGLKEAFWQLAIRFSPTQQPKPGALMTAEDKLQQRAAQPQLDGRSLVDLDFDTIRRRLVEMRNRVDEIRDWVDYRAVEEDFRQAGLHALHAEMTRRPHLSPDRLPDVVRRALLHAWTDRLFESEPSLGRFRAEDHEALIAEFRELDGNHCRLGAHRVISNAERMRPKAAVLQPGGEAAVLFREALKKRRHMPIRRLFAQIPNLLMRLKPCLLMSPLFVSQFLDPYQVTFDLVIFDEASQIRPADAVGSIYRGRQLIVAGDNRQLPPTSFFEQGMTDELDDEEVEEAFDVYDSILDQCVAIGMPQSWLRWHYRSRHEALIAFSNHRFYGNRLVTFPASHQQHPTLGVRFVYVPDGIYDRGGRRDNQREAEKVVALIVDHFLRYPGRSLGVVAFSLPQMNAIEDQLEKVLRHRPELERHFKGDRLEGFFVKNLENVQGDERDVMIFSVGYGRDSSGKLLMHFGPLNLPGGERRLNVAVTRAREKVIVVSSIRAADFDLSATQVPGVLALYHYLDYAERGQDALGLRLPGGSGEFESPLEMNVAEAIRGLGYDVVPQVGCSGFRIDLGVVDPAEPGRFILGVECDGASYHSSHTARDRDRLRKEALERLGWRIHRVWAPDWVSRRETELRRLRQAIESARTPKELGGNNPSSSEEQSTNHESIVVHRAPDPVESSEVPASWAVQYRICIPRSWPPPGLAFYEPAARRALEKMLGEVVDNEGPIHVEVAARRVASRWGLQRIGNRMVEAIYAALDGLERKGEIARRGLFLWPRRQGFVLRVRRPDPNDSDTVRKIEYIPDEELELAIRNLVHAAMSIPRDSLPAQVARVFGFDRTGVNIREQVERILEHMLRRGDLVLKGNRILPN